METYLCDDSSCITEKVFVSTVHKAKGLEFENVIVFEATDGIYPFIDKKTPEEIRESAGLLYVAMNRAKKRLHIKCAESVSGISKWGNPYFISAELVCTLLDEEAQPYFTRYPLFGLPTEVEDCVVIIKGS